MTWEVSRRLAQCIRFVPSAQKQHPAPCFQFLGRNSRCSIPRPDGPKLGTRALPGLLYLESSCSSSQLFPKDLRPWDPGTLGSWVLLTIFVSVTKTAGDCSSTVLEQERADSLPFPPTPHPYILHPTAGPAPAGTQV